PQLGPRPPNSFILFRCWYVKVHKGEDAEEEAAAAAAAAGRRRGRPAPVVAPKPTLSKRASDEWNLFTKEQKAPWFTLAKRELEEHMRRNPGYAFRPNKKTRSTTAR
ncbi:uncharacterized protein BXZ73DRAFT_488, partial [Epithele typhae]|uniref:uncharacterized protein n=1 Tax=Epithele typhae TaxID=378194 RepID=UPI002007971B